MDPVVAILLLVLTTVTVTTLFAVARKKGEGLGPALLGISLGWASLLLPLAFFGPVGAVIGMAVIVLVGGLVVFLGSYEERGRLRP